MTSIAWDGKELAADGLACRGETIVHTNVNKILKLKNGGYVAWAGSVTSGLAFKKWLDAEADAPDGIGDYIVLYIDPKGKPWFYDNTTKVVMSAPKRGAFGSGMDAAMAVLEHKGTALEAITIACKIDPFSGGKIRSVRYKD